MFKVKYDGPWPREIRIGKNGVVETSKTFELKGVTPEMVEWFNKNLTTELYLKWHPDHIARKKIEWPGKPPIYEETQRIGGHVYIMHLLKSEVLPDGSRASRLKYPLWTFYNESKSTPTPTGLMRQSKGWIGSDVPFFGWFWNLYLRTFVFPKFMPLQFKHQDEESMFTQNVLPGIYAEYMRKQKES